MRNYGAISDRSLDETTGLLENTRRTVHNIHMNLGEASSDVEFQGQILREAKGHLEDMSEISREAGAQLREMQRKAQLKKIYLKGVIAALVLLNGAVLYRMGTNHGHLL